MYKKEVVAIVPVKNLNAETLQKMIVDVLRLLHKTGFGVVTIMADNRINRNAFTLLCNGTLQTMIHNPFSGRPLFFLFDTVHLMKCIRNNWLVQNDVEKTFPFPHIHFIRTATQLSPSLNIDLSCHILQLYTLPQHHQCHFKKPPSAT